MNLELSSSGKRIVTRASEIAKEFGHNYVGTEHLLIALAENPSLRLSNAIRELGTSPRDLIKMVRDQIELGTSASSTVPLTPRSKKILALAVKEAHRLGSKDADPEHIFVACAIEGQGVAGRVLLARGAEPDILRQKLWGEAYVPRDFEVIVDIEERHHLSIWIDPGSSNHEELLELFSAASNLCEAHGGPRLFFARNNSQRPLALESA